MVSAQVYVKLFLSSSSTISSSYTNVVNAWDITLSVSVLVQLDLCMQDTCLPEVTHGVSTSTLRLLLPDFCFYSHFSSWKRRHTTEFHQ